jgi:hypothetical protein
MHIIKDIWMISCFLANNFKLKEELHETLEFVSA